MHFRFSALERLAFPGGAINCDRNRVRARIVGHAGRRALPLALLSMRPPGGALPPPRYRGLTAVRQSAGATLAAVVRSTGNTSDDASRRVRRRSFRPLGPSGPRGIAYYDTRVGSFVHPLVLLASDAEKIRTEPPRRRCLEALTGAPSDLTPSPTYPPGPPPSLPPILYLSHRRSPHTNTGVRPGTRIHVCILISTRRVCILRRGHF